MLGCDGRPGSSTRIAAPGGESHPRLRPARPAHAARLDAPASRQPLPTPVVPDYTLIRRVGGGAYGEVWLARNFTGSFFAIKIVHRCLFDHERPYERELAGIRRFEPISRSHPSQVAIHHVGQNTQDGYFYCVTDLADDARAEGNTPEGNQRSAISGQKSVVSGQSSVVGSPSSEARSPSSLRCGHESVARGPWSGSLTLTSPRP